MAPAALEEQSAPTDKRGVTRRLRGALIGEESLVGQCAAIFAERGHDVMALVTANEPSRQWAAAAGVRVVDPGGDLAGTLGPLDLDLLFSVTNLAVLAPEVLALPRLAAVNFHDGPLPQRAGVNVTAWALLEGATEHAVTWHEMTAQVDAGDVLHERWFAIDADETTYTLNAKCYEAAIDSFAELVDGLAAERVVRRRQDPAQLRYHRRGDRLPRAGLVSFGDPPDAVDRLVRATTFGDRAPNPLGVARLVLGDDVVVVTGAHVADGDLVVTAVTAPDGTPLPLPATDAPAPTAETVERLVALDAAAVRSEAFWVERLATGVVPVLPHAPTGRTGTEHSVPAGLTPEVILAAFTTWLHRVCGQETFDVGLAPGLRFRSTFRPAESIRTAAAALAAEVEAVRRAGPWWPDVALRYPVLHGMDLTPPAAVVDLDADLHGPVPAGVLRLAVAGDRYRLDGATERAAEQLATLVAALAADPDAEAGTLPIVGPDEQALLDGWNRTAARVPAATVHGLFAAQAARTPDAQALTAGAGSVTYAELDAWADATAARLRDAGVQPHDLVAIHVPRSIEMVVAVLATLKAGAAYVPVDPAYPAARRAHMLTDAGVVAVLGPLELRVDVPVLTVAPPSTDQRAVEDLATPEDLAYVIYTSGSTGVPKGVMVEHRNVVNFFVGMDAVIDHDPPGTWLAVTSLSFDISVLELLWTLTRGFSVVLQPDAVAAGAGLPRPLDLSLFYFASDDAPGPYRLLLEGARFADRHGFEAVWTPERHFHAFGGSYPNPAVTGAAVAAVTERVAVRGGSVVLPLHSPVRVAEEWAVVDNLSGGRVGISVAAGWQPDDFVLRPESHAGAKDVMVRDLDVVRRLWRGEAVTLPGPEGPVDVRTLPRPVQPELPVWLTAAGNPATFELAGRLGANVLTHLLGQTVEDLAAKIDAYRAARAAAGHAGDGRVTVMVHTFLGEDGEAVREAVRGPLKRYLGSSVDLLRNSPWSFPTFAGRGGGELDLDQLTEDELDSLLEVAFDRYYGTSGLFGTVDDGLAMLHRLALAGADEIACLIDFGIDDDAVLDGLEHLGTLRGRAVPAQPAAADGSLPALVERHGVTHLQCTPSLAAMLTSEAAGRKALGRLSHLLVGGEALPRALAGELVAAGPRRITNMYGPTETTIWSTTAEVGDGPVVIGRPIANTTLHVVDPNGEPVPVGTAGELLVGGAGVVRGYLGRPELTAERFRTTPTGEPGYATGDLVRLRDDGDVEYLGRNDHQVKLRGYRIELGEIEARLDGHPSVGRAVVVLRDQRLVAYVEPTAGESPEQSDLRDHVRAALPEPMVPAVVVVLDRLPLTPNGKVDRAALPEPAGRLVAERSTRVAPAGDLEAQVAQVWCEALGSDQVGVEDNFFDLGGHSLLAVRVYRSLVDSVAPGLVLTDLFRYPTIRSLVAAMSGPGAEPADLTAGQERGHARRAGLARRRAARSRTGEG